MRIIALAASALAVAPQPASARMTDAQIRQRIVRESVNGYPGNCPCPYSSASNGSSCGRRSAYSRPGGYAPKCYAADVSDAEVRAYRRSH